MNTIWKKIQNKIQNNYIVYLLTVVENFGSSPGRCGFKMFISDDNYISGTIGGGVMEYKIAEKLKELLRSKILEVGLIKQVHKKRDINSSGMICSGEQTITYHSLTKKNLKTINNIIECIDSNKEGVLELTPSTIKFKSKKINEKYSFQYDNNNKWSFTEQIGSIETFYIVGAGHVALATSKILKILNFKVVLFDNRNKLNTFKLNSYADEKHIISYDRILNFIPNNKRNFIALMTNKYTEDKLVLSKLINSDFFYLGVLGSKEKVKTMFTELLREGVTKEKLSKIYSPIGIPIKSQTPEEIAISIASEVIQVKNLPIF